MWKVENYHLILNNQTVPMDEIEKTSVCIVPRKKEAKRVLGNVLANTLSHSISNGDEFVDVVLEVVDSKGNTKNLCVNEKPLVRNNMDYHACVKEAREIQNLIRKK